MPTVLALYRTLSKVPAGRTMFSVVFARKAVHNHIGTVHAIAACNGLEAGSTPSGYTGCCLVVCTTSLPCRRIRLSSHRASRDSE